MIYLKYDNFQTTNIIPMQEKIIGTVGSNNSAYRIFSLPKTFNELDLSEEDFTFILQINPIEKSKDPYFQILEKTILEDSIELKWVINNSNTSMYGNLEISIKAQKEENNIIWESNILTFEVLKGIDASDSVSEIPPNIMEQYILQAANHAERSVSGANLTYEMIQNFEVDLTKKADLDDAGKIPLNQIPIGIGGEIDLGNIYTKTEIDDLLIEKQNKIDELDAIISDLEIDFTLRDRLYGGI